MAPSIQSELKQTKPFRSLEQEAAISLERTSEGLRHGFDELFREHGLTGTQYNVLRILRGAGEAGLACSEIGERMISRDPDITRLLDRMECAGLCVRQRHPQDRRVILTRITPRGLELLKKLDGPVNDLHRAQLGHMGEARLRSLLDLLEVVRDGSR